jgi:dihydrofolate reductase
MSKPIISIVVAIAQNRAIGKDNQLLWHLPQDLKHFKNITSGHTVIMGRKTYDSIGKPLPNRRNLIITRQEAFQALGVEVVYSFDEALRLSEGEAEVFVIGGAEIYKLALPYCEKLYLTLVDCHPEADAYFPELDLQQWTLVEKISHPADEKHAYPYQFLTYKK